jgi:hypothetical protein
MSVNRSKAYILPLLNHYVDLQFVKNILNTYLFIEDDLNDYIIIEYNDIEEEDFQNYLIELSVNDYFKNIIKKDNKVYCIFDVNDNVRSDYDKFVNGKFSKISKNNKNKIISFSLKHYGVSNIQTINKIKKILNKDEELRRELEEELDVNIPENSELSSIPDMNNETLKL